MLRAALASVNRPAELIVRREFVACGARQVHYRRAGVGPPAILWNQLPQNSASLDQLMRRLAPHFTVFVIDLPGFGLSNPLTQEAPTIADLAGALAETLDALGIEKAVLVARQIGIPIALEFCRRHADRIAAAALDRVHDAGEANGAERLKRFAHDCVPNADGSHLIAAWARLRDEHMYNPGAARSAATRRLADMPAPQSLHEDCFMEMLRSSAAVRRMLGAALDYDVAGAIRELTVPMAVFCADGDALLAHASAVPADNVRIERLRPGESDAAVESIAEFLLSFTTARSYEPRSLDANAAPMRELLVAIRSGSVNLLARSAGEGGGRPVVLLHGAGESSLVFDDLRKRLAQSRRVIAFDLPGHGESDRILEGFVPRFLAAALAEALDGFDLAEVDFFGRGLGAAIAVELALAEPHRAAHLAIVDQPLLGAEERAEFFSSYAPPIEPVWDGTHLLALWNQILAREYFWPWFKQKKSFIRQIEPSAEAAAVHARVFDALRCGPGYAHANRNWIDWPAQQRIERLVPPLLVIGRRGDGWSRDVETMAASARRGAIGWVDGGTPDIAAVLEKFLDN